MFNFQAFFASLLLGIPWLVKGNVKRFFAVWIMIGIIAAGVAATANMKAAANPVGLLPFLILPACLSGFFFASKTPRSVFLRWIVIVFGGGALWIGATMAFEAAQRNGLIPSPKIYYEAPIGGALAGDVKGHATLTLSKAQTCKKMGDTRNIRIAKLEKRQSELEAEHSKLLDRGFELALKGNELDRRRGTNKTNAAIDRFNADIRAMNAEARRFNEAQKANTAAIEANDAALANASMPADTYLKACRENKAIHYDIYSKVCKYSDVNPDNRYLGRKSNIFCRGYTPHANRLIKSVRK